MNTAFVVGVVLLNFLFVANASNSTDGELVDYRLTVTRKEIAPFFGKDDCSAEDKLVCQDCTSMGLCIADGSGSWNVINAGNCETGETCLRGTCSTAANPPCASNLDFICTSTGVFPDQENCKRHHFCVIDPAVNQLKAFGEMCADYYGYHSQTTYCSKQMKTEECDYYPVPVCKALGETGGLQENPVLYYICIRRTVAGSNDVLYPVVYACEHGRSFDKYSGKCKTK